MPTGDDAAHDAWLDVVLRPGRDRSVRAPAPVAAGGLGGAGRRCGRSPAPGVRARGGRRAARLRASTRPSSHAARAAAGVRQGGAASRLARRTHPRGRGARRDDPRLAARDALRLVNAEGDFLPGLVADRYGDVVVVRATAVGMAMRRDEVADALRAATGAAAGFERPDAAAARREGMAAHQGPLWGAAPAAPVAIAERGRRYWIDAVAGQKTGFYLDQRDARDLVERLARAGACSTSSRTRAASPWRPRAAARRAHRGRQLRRGAGGRAAESRALRGVAAARGARRRLPLRAPGRRAYDLLVVDPPPLARRAGDVTRAARAYKDALLGRCRWRRPTRCCSPSPARTTSGPSCSARSSSAPRSMPAGRSPCSPSWAPPATTRCRSTTPKAAT
jgi:23S rRNA (cytosine1962-C5)-methyltransferase